MRKVPYLSDGEKYLPYIELAQQARSYPKTSFNRHTQFGITHKELVDIVVKGLNLTLNCWWIKSIKTVAAKSFSSRVCRI